MLSERTSGLLSKGTRSITLHQGEGSIKTIKWNMSFVAWANSKGVKIYDMDAKERIVSIPFEFEELSK